MRRLLPVPVDDIDPAVAYADESRRPHADGRPWFIVNMVASLDGATAVTGRSAGLSGPADREVFHALRALAGVVVVGAGTARAEGYRPPRTAGQSIALVTKAMRFDGLDALLASGRALAITVEDSPAGPAGIDVIRAGRGEVDLHGALVMLRDRTGADVALCEGGPHLNGAAFAAGVVDELCLTISPLVVAGAANRVVAAQEPLDPPVGFTLTQVCESEGSLLLRYCRA